MVDEGIEQLAVGAVVGAEPARGRLDGSLEQHRRAVVERMRQRHLGLHQLKTVLRQGKLSEERRHQRQGVHRGARVVHEARQRELFRPAAAAEGVSALEHGHLTSGLRQRDRRGQAVGARPDDDRLLVGPIHSIGHG